MNRVIIQAGGKGVRLRPYTAILPKPLMPVGDWPILEIMIRQLVHNGFDDITITVGHLSHLIRAIIGDGRQFGAKIDYTQEDEPRGTIGAVRQAQRLDRPFLVMNGDLLTDFDYRKLMDAHVADGADLSIAVYQKKVPVSLGVFEMDAEHHITGFREKPVLTFPCSMGIYAFSPKLVDLIPERGVFGFDDLMALCLSRKTHVHAYPFGGLWYDIGRPEDYEEAVEQFVARKDLVPGS
jgi:NDP-sugar pyrophosphorylase family protein